MMKKYKLLKKSLLLIAITSLIGLVFSAIYIQNDTSLDSLRDVTPQTRISSIPGQVKIGVIGDSWVAGQKLDRAIEQAVTASGLKTIVLSSGHPGAKSRQIYRNLFLDSGENNSSSSLFMDEALDYLVIVAGVNDSAGHAGKTFYAHHVLLIVQAALARGVKPVIVEVPEYGIEDTAPTGFLSWGKKFIYLWLFDSGNVDVIKEYRMALREKIKAASILDKVLLVDFSRIIEDYNTSKGLYANPSHLNSDGHSKLGELIAHSLVEWHNQQDLDLPAQR